MILIKEFSLASRFIFLNWNLPCKILQIAKCEALIGALYFYELQKKMTRKTNLIVYYTFSVSISLILYNNWYRNFENYSFMLTKFDRYFV